MNTRVLPWFEDEDPRDVTRWATAALIVVALHLAAIAAYVYVHRPDTIDDDETAITIDIAPGEDQLEVAPVLERKLPDVEKPPPDTSEAVAEPPPPPKIEQQPPTPPRPAVSKGGNPHIVAEWERSLTRHLEKFKRYPSGAQSRGEEGLVLLRFSVDRTGRVLAHQIAQSSGYPELDAEVMSMIERAQPLPPFPPTMAEPELDQLIVPIRFSLR